MFSVVCDVDWHDLEQADLLVGVWFSLGGRVLLRYVGRYVGIV